MRLATEAEIQRAILHYLNLIGYAVKLPAGGARRGEYFVRLCPQGTPDILAVVKGPDGRGVFCGFEVKKPGGRLRQGQGETLDIIRKHGGIAAVVRSVGDVERVLRAEGVIS